MPVGIPCGGWSVVHSRNERYPIAGLVCAETIAVLSDTDVLRALTQADAELAAGQGENEATLRAAMRSRRQ
jgi:hypothetical protein